MSCSPIFRTKTEALLTSDPGWNKAEGDESLGHSSGFYQYFFPVGLKFADNIRIPPGNIDSLSGALKFLWDELMNWNHGAKEEALSSVTWLSSDRRGQVTKKSLVFVLSFAITTTCVIIPLTNTHIILHISLFPYYFTLTGVLMPVVKTAVRLIESIGPEEERQSRIALV